MTDHPTELPKELGTSLASTLQHITLIREREARLIAAREEAQEQLLHRLGSAHRCGDIDDRQLHAAFEVFKAANTPRRMHGWDAHIDIPWKSMVHLARFLPNGPDGTWFGTWPTDDGPIPRGGVSVVYVLFGPDNDPCYVGSTSSFRSRIGNHGRDGKAFTHWQAFPCRDREHAYELEVRLLKERRPYLNRKAGR